MTVTECQVLVLMCPRQGVDASQVLISRVVSPKGAESTAPCPAPSALRWLPPTLGTHSQLLIWPLEALHKLPPLLVPLTLRPTQRSLRSTLAFPVPGNSLPADLSWALLVLVSAWMVLP